QLLLNAAIIVGLLSRLLQGASLPMAARLCKVEIPPTSEPLNRTCLDVIVDSDYELMVYQLSQANCGLVTPLRSLKMPPDTRIAAVFRQRKLLHPSGSTRLELNDVLCVVVRGRDLPALSRLFSTTSTRQHLNNRQFFGDFILDG